jgi:hypothetical protein
MNSRGLSRWIRLLALLQGLLLLPTVLGSICLHDSGGPIWEWEPCACPGYVAASGVPRIVTISAETSDCGPCYEGASTALRTARISEGRWAFATIAFQAPVLGADPATTTVVPLPSPSAPPRPTLPTLRC